MKKNTCKIGVFLAILIVAGAILVIGNSFINKKTETLGSNTQPGIETKTNKQPYTITGTINKVSL